MVLVETAIKHPQAPQGAKNVVPRFSGARNIFLRMRSAVAGLRQSNSHARPRMKRNNSEVECRDSSVKRRGKNIRQPEAFLDLGQSDRNRCDKRREVTSKRVLIQRRNEGSGANPDGCAKEQPLKKHRAADLIRLEWSAMKESACSVMKWSEKQTNE